MDYACEYAKSSRASCKLCRAGINQGNLRLAIYVQSPHFDGKIPNWYHYSCFFKKATPPDTSSIKGFDAIRYDDQLKIKNRLGLDTSTSDLIGGSSASIDNFSIEYAKSARGKCKKCDKKIENAAVKIVVKGRGSKQDGSYHLDCFAANKKELEFDFDVKEMTGFDQIEEKDQNVASKAIGQPDKKRKLNNDEAAEEAIKNDADLTPEAKKIKLEELQKEKELKAQSQEFWKLRDMLDKELPNEVIKQLIEANSQQVKLTGRDDLLTFLCDCMYFGPLERCTECSGGQLVYRGFAYCCTGNVTSWTSCRFKTQSPQRKTDFFIDSDLKEDYNCLKQFKFKPRVRVFANKLDDRAGKDKTGEGEEGLSETFTKPKRPLFHLNFSSSGKLTRNSAQIKLIIEKLGGKFSSTIDTFTVAVISNSDEVKKQNKNMRLSRGHHIPVVSEDFLTDLVGENVDVEQLVLKHKISEWDTDVKKRMELSIQYHELQEKGKEDMFSLKSAGFDKIKVSVKGGAAVDPDSGLAEKHHVLIETTGLKEPYSCVLGLVDIIRGTNSYYKLQIIEPDTSGSYFLFRSWGRVGTTIGGNKLEQHSTMISAITAFETIYLEKTGNSWSSRKTASKLPNKFFPLEIDYGDDQNDDDLSSQLTDENRVSKSTLAKPIQEVIKLIFDIKKMKEQMKEFELDLNKMPLGKISSNQINRAFGVLNEINNLINSPSATETLFVDASNRFYTLIPHDFGLKSPTILNDAKLIKEKTDMLNSLLDIEIAYNILKGDSNKDEEDPIDMHYKRLDCKMEVLDKSSDEFKRILDYVANTHAHTHSSYQLEVVDVFKINRGNEEERFQKFKSLHNRKLLWHGSRLTNFAGILSQGLRIAPPEAPVSGYMFGKGVYFADMVSKSANYCFTNKQNPTALMLLCEVALGDMYERFKAEYVKKLPDGKHSTKGCGRTIPDPAESYFTPDGVEIPMGKGTNAMNGASVLLYNEFIVYDTAQVAMRYLLRVHFKHLY